MSPVSNFAVCPEGEGFQLLATTGGPFAHAAAPVFISLPSPAELILKVTERFYALCRVSNAFNDGVETLYFCRRAFDT